MSGERVRGAGGERVGGAGGAGGKHVRGASDASGEHAAHPDGTPEAWRMGRRQRTRILVDGNPRLAAALCERIQQRYPVVPLVDPHETLVVIKVREGARGSLFYLGEALATECRVLLDEVPGVGLLLGSERRRAFELAVIDAAMSAPTPLPEEPSWVSLLQAEEARLAEASRAGQRRLASTRVEFSSLPTQEDRRD
jgi:alpha-D-ribose 1-methylphosphonate 5-triphosphate synthase subunit PhnG